MAGDTVTSLVDEAKLENQALGLNEFGSASPDTGPSSSDSKDDSPRQLHGWKVCQSYGKSFLFAESCLVGDSIRFDAVHHISFCAG